MSPRLEADDAEATRSPEPPAGAGAVGQVAWARLWSTKPSVLAAHASAVPAYLTVALTVLWAAHDGGYDQDTWYWGALVLLAVLVAVGIMNGVPRIPRATKLALLGFGLYISWSYLSITWSQSPGDALSGSNLALLYFLVFAAFSIPRWRPRQVAAILVLYTLAIGVIGALMLIEMAGGQSITALFSEGRLLTPTGYFNSNAALFNATALLAVALSTRREFPVLLRGLLLAVACGSLDLAVLAQSRGWLFTLPFVLVAAIAVCPDRLRSTAAALLPALGALVAARPLLDVYQATTGAHPTAAALTSAAERAGRISLLVCAAVLLIGTLLAALDARVRGPQLSPSRRRAIGTGVAVLVLAVGAAGGTVATHGHPVRFVKDQWNGFTNASASSTAASHFGDIGSGRYDAWRVALDAFLAHPIGGLGQDNFADYYIRHRRTDLELQWTHSLEMRLLAHTGLVGTIFFVMFLAGALVAALHTRRRADRWAAAMAGIALLPLVVWLIHGSIDWFWEMPALSGPALGFLAMAGALGRPERVETTAPSPRRAAQRALRGSVGLVGFLAAVAVLAFPYLSVREVSTASDLRVSNPTQALRDLNTAADLNPLNADPGRIGGTIALQNGLWAEAQRRFDQATVREPGGWYGWLGAGLAASALGQRATARHDFRTAHSINSQEPAIAQALARVDTPRPLTPSKALQMLVVAG